MALKWDVERVQLALDKMETTVQRLKPTQKKLDHEARQLRKMKSLPQYVTQRIDTLIFNNKAMIDRAYAEIKSIRASLPVQDRDPGKKRFYTLVENAMYRVVCGGAFLMGKVGEDSPYSWSKRDEARNLHIGDVVQYLGQQTGLTWADPDQPQDAFAIDGYRGVFRPAPKGKANRAFLELIQ